MKAGVDREGGWYCSFSAVFAFFCSQSHLPREIAQSAERFSLEHSDSAGRHCEFEGTQRGP